MIAVWWWAYPVLTSGRSTLKPEQVGFVPVPGLKAGTNANTTTGMPFSLSKLSKNKDAAWEYMKWMTNPELEVEIVADKSDPDTNEIMVVHKSSFANEKLNALTNGLHREGLRSLEGARSMPQIREWPQVAAVLESTISDIASSGRPIKPAMDEAAAQVDRARRRAGGRAGLRCPHARKPGRTGLLKWGLLAPALLLVCVTLLYPLVQSFWYSLHEWNLGRGAALGPFVGAGNYAQALTDDPDFWNSVRVTAVFTAFSVVLTIGIAMGLAVLLAGVRPLEVNVRTLMVIPFAMSPALVGVSWRFLLNPEFGAVDASLKWLIPGLRGQAILAEPTLAMAALIAVDVWHWAPYFMLTFVGCARLSAAGDGRRGRDGRRRPVARVSSR